MHWDKCLSLPAKVYCTNCRTATQMAGGISRRDMQRRGRYIFEKKENGKKTFRRRYPWKTYDGIEEKRRDNTLSLSLLQKWVGSGSGSKNTQNLQTSLDIQSGFAERGGEGVQGKHAKILWTACMETPLTTFSGHCLKANSIWAFGRGPG